MAEGRRALTPIKRGEPDAQSPCERDRRRLALDAVKSGRERSHSLLSNLGRVQSSRQNRQLRRRQNNRAVLN
jgi:hypothetical protein